MSTEQARALVRRALTDADFRARLEAAPATERRAILDEEGFGDVRLVHLSESLPRSHGGELTDAEFAAVSGGLPLTTSLETTSLVSIGVLAVAAF